MQIKLAENESLIKTWTYAHTKRRLERTEHSLMVTDKRIISSSENKKELTRKEIYLKDVKSMEYSYARHGLFGAILLLILGIITAIAIIGIFFIVKAVRIFKEKLFVLLISAYGIESCSLAVGSTQFNLKKRGKLKARVHKDDVLEIVDELGAIILEKKA